MCEGWEITPETDRWTEFSRDYELPEVLCRWSTNQKEDFLQAGLSACYLDLDGEVEADYLRPYELMMCGPYAASMTVLDALSDEKAEKLRLHLVEGDAPGRDFMGVYFEGSLDDLNNA